MSVRARLSQELLSLQLWVVLVLVFPEIPVILGQSSCPSDTEHLYRLGQTRFYVIQKPESMRINWYYAKHECRKHGLTLAKIDDLQTEVHVGRQLEAFMVPRAWPENYYWLDAKYNALAETYIWEDTKRPIKFSNFFYSSPRPKGFGDLYTKDGQFIVNPRDRLPHCLAISLPLPLKKDYDPTAPHEYGAHTAWWERLCTMDIKANILCESHKPECEELQQNSIYTEASTTYYEDFWPMAHRRFVAMWAPRNFQDAKTLCESQKMLLYEPKPKDKCLIPHLKKWMTKVTSYSFWTGIKFDVDRRTYLYSNGREVPLSARNMTWGNDSFVTTIGGGLKEPFKALSPEDTCVSLTWNDEVPASENVNFCNCPFNSAVLSPENCKDPVGVICQHPHLLGEETCSQDYIGRVKEKGLVYYKNETEKLKEFFPFDGRTDLMRSAFKQRGDKAPCPKGYTRVGVDTVYWGTSEDFQKSLYQYDYLSPYWMKPGRKGARICSISKVTFDPASNKLSRSLTPDSCKKWRGFILCQKTSFDDKPRASDTGDEKVTELAEEDEAGNGKGSMEPP